MKVLFSLLVEKLVEMDFWLFSSFLGLGHQRPDPPFELSIENYGLVEEILDRHLFLPSIEMRLVQLIFGLWVESFDFFEPLIENLDSFEPSIEN